MSFIARRFKVNSHGSTDPKLYSSEILAFQSSVLQFDPYNYDALMFTISRHFTQLKIIYFEDNRSHHISAILKHNNMTI